MIVRGVPILAMLVTLVLDALPALAHPLGNFTVNHLAKISVGRERVNVRYVLDLAEIPSFQIMRQRNADGRFDRAQLEAWARSVTPTVLAGFTLTADDAPVTLTADAPRARMHPGAGGLPLLYWRVDLHGKLPAARDTRTLRSLRAADRVYVGRIGWKDIIVAPQREPTNELLSYPNALLGSPRRISAIAASIAPSGAAMHVIAEGETVPAPAGSASQVRSNTLSDLLARGSSNPFAVLLTVFVAVGLGALHALEPGHGKTLLAVSLAGARASAKEALILAAGLTFAHTIGVLLLGIALLLTARWIVPEVVYPWITVASGTAVACLGAGALARYVHAHGDDHEHGHAHTSPRDHPLSFGSVVLVAMSGNIAPCPAALVVLLTALMLHHVVYGMIVILAFSLGLAALLTAMGIGVVRGACWISRRPELDRIVAHAPLFSACAISLIGAVMIGRGLERSPLFGTPALGVTLLVLCAIAGYAMSRRHTHARDYGRSNV